MVIRQADKRTFDVFLSDQYWDDHIRVRRQGDNLFYVSGKRVPKKVLDEIKSVINGVNSNAGK